MTRYETILKSFEEMEVFAATIAQLVTAPCYIALQGDLGAGKTTFARGFLQALGYKGNVKSPTYTILEPYQIDSLTVNHFDLYRMSDPDELELIGAHEMFSENCINLIEWPEQGEGWLPTMDLWIEITHLKQGRHVCVKASSVKGEKILQSLQK